MDGMEADATPSRSASPVRESGGPAPTPLSGKRRTWLIITPLLIFGLIAVYMAWDNMYGASAKKRVKEREDQAQTERYHAYLKTFEDAMRADTYGGQTPEETLQLFITALKAGDIDLASRYFALETNENSPDYLTRKTWQKALQEAQAKGNIPSTIKMLERAKPAGSVMEGYFGFEVRGEKNELLGDIGLKLNEQSNVWKIQNL
ncbi:MAG: hypothetical protein Q7S84_00385 [bacterium]|nr:hypothetical protein [bacterium]